MNTTHRSPETQVIRILIVDDHPLMREGIRLTLEGQDDMTVVGEAPDCDAAFQLAQELNPDVTIVDLTLEQGNGLDLINTLGSSGIDTKVLVLTMHDENVYAERCLRAGARGFLMKGSASETLIDAIRTVQEGKMYASENLLQRVLAALLAPTSNDRQDLSELTDREFQVFELLGQGRTSKEVAETLGLSSKTVDVHRIRIRNKLNISSNSDLVRFAVEWRREHETPPEPEE